MIGLVASRSRRPDRRHQASWVWVMTTVRTRPPTSRRGGTGFRRCRHLSGKPSGSFSRTTLPMIQRAAQQRPRVEAAADRPGPKSRGKGALRQSRICDLWRWRGGPAAARGNPVPRSPFAAGPTRVQCGAADRYVGLGGRKAARRGKPVYSTGEPLHVFRRLAASDDPARRAATTFRTRSKPPPTVPQQAARWVRTRVRRLRTTAEALDLNRICDLWHALYLGPAAAQGSGPALARRRRPWRLQLQQRAAARSIDLMGAAKNQKEAGG